MERCCNNCWHFDRRDYAKSAERQAPYKGFAICLKIPHSEDMTEWDEDGNNVLKKEYRKTRAFVADASGYSADLLVRPDFKCIHFKKRTEKENT